MTAARRAPASTTSRCMTVLRWPTWSATTRSTTRPMARTTATAPTTTTATIAGVEGPTDDPPSSRCAASLRKNQLACLLLAQGVPLILAGDEVGNIAERQQQRLLPGQRDRLGRAGRISASEGEDLTDFIGQLTGLRQRFPQLRSQRWLDGRRAGRLLRRAVADAAAEEMTEPDWNFPEGRFLAYVLGPLEQAEPPIFIVLNAAPEAIEFKLPKIAEYKSWMRCSTRPRASRRTSNSALAPRPGHRPARCSPLRARHECAGSFGPQLTTDGARFRLWAPGGEARRSAALG